MIKKYCFGYFGMTHDDLNRISEWEYVERVDGLLMRQEDDRDKGENMVDYIADFFSQLIVTNLAGKVKKNSLPGVDDVKKGLFQTTKEREERALEELEKTMKTQEEKAKDAEKEKARLLSAFGIK